MGNWRELLATGAVVALVAFEIGRLSTAGGLALLVGGPAGVAAPAPSAISSAGHGHGTTSTASAVLSRPAGATGQAAPAAPSGETKRFTLYVRPGQLTLPDGKRTFLYGFTDEPQGQAQLPGPTLTVDEGDTVEVTLINDQDPTANAQHPEGEGHTVHLHGLDVDFANDGVPESLPEAQPVKQGQTFTYRFLASHAGTYFYHCHENTVEHQQMGMYGALIVQARGGAKTAWTDGPAFEQAYTLLLSELDTVGHEAVQKTLTQNGRPYNWVGYRPTYFLINGQAAPDLEADPRSVPRAKLGERVLVRLINAGYVPHSLHLHGFHFQVIASDGRPLPAPYWKDTLLLGPGERYDLLVTADKVGHYPFHDHIEPYLTNNGAYLGGMHTMFMVD